MAHNPVHTVIKRWFSIKRSELRFVNGWHVMLFSTRRIVKRGALPPGKSTYPVGVKIVQGLEDVNLLTILQFQVNRIIFA